MKKLVVFCDGRGPLHTGDEKISFYGWIAYSDGIEMASGQGQCPYEPETTCTTAEYCAIIEALNFGNQHLLPKEILEIRNDNKPIIDKLNDKSEPKKLKHLYCKVRELIDQKPNTKLVWIDRKQNKKADKLAREEYKRVTKMEALETEAFNISL